MRQRKRNRVVESRFNHLVNESEEKKVIYIADYASFDPEEDSYLEGEIGGGESWDIRLNLEAPSLEELFNKVKNKLHMGSDSYAWLVETSALNGRSCFLVEYTMDRNGSLASGKQIEAWKKGKERLWYVHGYVPVIKTMKPSNVPDEEMEEFALKNNLDIV